ncbi:DUF881 domain-containing protein [Brachybacterium hainanense]|uniref:DUF881 domain-containing protein n=1 Tax=Brachybacterium hainanense TaxID=1541174 RepID=A0ABV6RIF8_9MICO
MASSRPGGDGDEKIRRRPVLAQLALGGVFALSGALLVTSARVSGGGSIRDDSGDLADVLRERDRQARMFGEDVARKREEVEALTSGDGGAGGAPDAQQRIVDAAGLSAVHGPGLRVTLADAPAGALTSIDGVRPDDLVVHQQDLEAFINALWQGGAEGMMLQDQRVVAGSAFRCAGNTLLLQGRVYSPPFVVSVIGRQAPMRAALDASVGVRVYREWVDRVGLGLEVEELEDVTLPAYDGSLTLEIAEEAE